MPTTTNEHPQAPPLVTVPYPRLVWEVRHLGRVFELVRAADGPIATFRLGPARFIPPMVLIQTAEGAHEVLTAQAERFDKETPTHLEFQRLLGLSSFSMDDARWAARRRALQPVMNRMHVDGFVGHMQDAVDTAIARWPDQGVVELADVGRSLTLDVIGRSLFGLDLAARRDRIGPAMARSMRRLTIRSIAPVRLPHRLRTPRSWRDRAVLYGIVHEAIDLAEQRRRRHGAGGGELVDLLLDTCDPETGNPLDRDAVADELLTFLLAGHDTTATALAAALWLLARHPEVQERVRAEADELGDRLTAEDLARLPSTRQVLDETLRLYGPAEVVARTCIADAEVGGYRIPAGWCALVAISGIHRDPAVYPDPARFDPDRFDPAAVAGRARCAHLPFGAGRRSCSGSHFAVLEATVALAAIVRRFVLTTDQDRVRLTSPFTLHLKAPVAAEVTRRA